jgi:hypothetical protein
VKNFKVGDVVTLDKLIYFDRYRKVEVSKGYIVTEVICTGYMQLKGLVGYWNPQGFSLAVMFGK